MPVSAAASPGERHPDVEAVTGKGLGLTFGVLPFHPPLAIHPWANEHGGRGSPPGGRGTLPPLRLSDGHTHTV